MIAHACRGTGCWCASPPGTDPDITRPDGTPVLVAPSCPHGNVAGAYCVLCLRGRVAELEAEVARLEALIVSWDDDEDRYSDPARSLRDEADRIRRRQ